MTKHLVPLCPQISSRRRTGVYKCRATLNGEWSVFATIEVVVILLGGCPRIVIVAKVSYFETDFLVILGE